MSVIDLNDPKMFRIDTSGRSVGYFCKTSPVCVDADLLNALKRQAQQITDKDIRLCLHSTPEALFHDMIILTRKGRYQTPHKHNEKAESWHIIEGVMGVFVFDQAGKVIQASRLEPGGSIVYRIDPGFYHAVMPMSDIVLFHESRPGPYRGADSLPAPWAPDNEDIERLAEFYKKLQQLLP